MNPGDRNKKEDGRDGGFLRSTPGACGVVQTSYGDLPDMTVAEIRQAVIDILSDIAPDQDLSGLNDEVSFREQLEMDSMDFLDIVMELRKRYRIQIPEEDYPKLASMASTVAYLEPIMKDMPKK